jgi:SAM-dependent methyltransferase
MAADVGCGTGHAVNLLAHAYPASRFVGYDIAPDAIAVATAEAEAMGLLNTRFEVLDVNRLPSEPKLDLITAFDSIHDQVDPAMVLRNLRRALAKDGLFLMIDFKFSSKLEENVDNPFATLYYGISTMHCMTISLAEGGAGSGYRVGNPDRVSHARRRRLLERRGSRLAAAAELHLRLSALTTAQLERKPPQQSGPRSSTACWRASGASQSGWIAESNATTAAGSVGCPAAQLEGRRRGGGASATGTLLGRHRLDDQISVVRGIHRRCGKSERSFDQSADVRPVEIVG